MENICISSHVWHVFPLHFAPLARSFSRPRLRHIFLCLEKRKKKKEEMFDHVFLVHLRRRLPISLQSQNIQSPPSVLAAGPNNHLRFSSTRQNISCCGPPPAPPQPSRQTGKLRFRGRASGKTNRTWKWIQAGVRTCCWSNAIRWCGFFSGSSDVAGCFGCWVGLQFSHWIFVRLS